MKLDKETLIKERFWFLLPFVAIFILVAWICVLGVRGVAQENYKKADATNGQLVGITRESEVKNPQWIEAMEKEAAASEAKKEVLWYEEYNRQNKITREGKDTLKGTVVN